MPAIARHAAPLQLGVLDDPASVDAAREEWERVFACDRQAKVFQSWRWFRAYLESAGAAPLVLVAVDPASGARVGFFPLEYHSGPALRVLRLRRLTGAAHGIAGYTGMTVLPEHEEGAIDAFARYLAEQPRWDVIELDNVLDERVMTVVARLPAQRFDAAIVGSLRAPFVELPPSFEQFFAGLGKSSRARLRHAEHRLAARPRYRREPATRATIERGAEALLSLHETRWPLTDARRALVSALLRTAFERDVLMLVTMWDGDTAVAAAAAFVHPASSAAQYFMGGFNPRYASFSPGRLAITELIREAIARGCTTFDFTRGAEPYKYSFGAEDRLVRRLAVTRRRPKTVLIGQGRRAARGAATALRELREARHRLARRLFFSTRVTVFRGRIPTANDGTLPRGVRIAPLEPPHIVGRSAGELAALDLTAELCFKQWANGDFALGAFRGAALVGVLWCAQAAIYAPELRRLLHPLPATGYLYHCSVAWSEQGRGIATALIAAMSAEFAPRRLSEAWFMVHDHDAASLRAFEKAMQIVTRYPVTYRATPFGERLRYPQGDAAMRAFLGVGAPPAPRPQTTA